MSQVSFGSHGLEALKGEYESTAAIYAITPDFCPKPIAWGTLETAPDAHFYLCKFYEFFDGVPEPENFCEKLARLHSSHTSPEGKFGFHCTTYNGDLPQDNSCSDSWEVFFANGLRHILKIREERGGPNAELDGLLPGLFDKVIPRLLRPLESNGRSIEPSLVHGDLWCGNAAITNDETKEGIVFDPSSFWAHNECEKFRPLFFPGSDSVNKSKSQTNLGTGGPSGINSRLNTSTPTTPSSLRPSLKPTLATEMLSTHCTWPLPPRSPGNAFSRD